MPVWIPLAIAGASALYQGIAGAKKKAEARKRQAEADSQQQSVLAEAQRQAQVGMPEAEYQAALQQIYRNQSGALNALRGRRSVLAGAPAVQQNTSDALLKLASQDAAMRRQGQNIALNQGNQYSNYLDNQAASTRSAGEALTGAAINNVFNAATTYALGKSGMYGNMGNTGYTGTPATNAVTSGYTNNMGLNYSMFPRGNAFGFGSYSKAF